MRNLEQAKENLKIATNKIEAILKEHEVRLYAEVGVGIYLVDMYEKCTKAEVYGDNISDTTVLN